MPTPNHEFYPWFECEADLVMKYKVIFSATQQVCAEGVGFVGVVEKVNLSKTGFGSYRPGLCIGGETAMGVWDVSLVVLERHSAGLDRFFMSSEMF